MSEHNRACGRTDCSDCPKRRVGRCHATPEQQDTHTCTCGLSRSASSQTK